MLWKGRGCKLLRKENGLWWPSGGVSLFLRKHEGFAGWNWRSGVLIGTSGNQSKVLQLPYPYRGRIWYLRISARIDVPSFLVSLHLKQPSPALPNMPCSKFVLFKKKLLLIKREVPVLKNIGEKTPVFQPLGCLPCFSETHSLWRRSPLQPPEETDPILFEK